MRLYPQARPVQINKLRLGGKDINTKEDLLNNFCLSEIIELGGKFTQWLDRNEEVQMFADSVSNIFNATKNKEKQAEALVQLFFPLHEKQALMEILLAWQEYDKDKKVLIDLLNCFSPNAQLAIELMQKNFRDKKWITEWLANCVTKINLSSDFCYEYGLYLKDVDLQKSKYWLNKAKNMGNTKAEKILRKGVSFDLEIKGHVLTMIRFHSDEGDFYISKTIIPNELFEALGCAYNHNPKEKVSYRKRLICDDALKKLRTVTNYRWTYPSFSQWETAIRSQKLQEAPTKDGEWCLEYNHREEGEDSYRVGGYRTKYLRGKDMSFLRPVLLISQNPELQ